MRTDNRRPSLVSLLAVALLMSLLLACGEITRKATPTPYVIVVTPTPIPTSPPRPTVTLKPTAAPQAAPAFGPVVFSDGITDDEKPTRPATRFPAGTKEIYAFFDYEGLTDGLEWTRVWYYEGEELIRQSETWTGGASGNWWVAISHDDGFAAGIYEVRLFLGDRMLASAACVLEAVAQPVAPTLTAPPPKLTATPPPRPTATPAAAFRGRIAYTVGLEDLKNYQVWIMNADGSDKKLLAELASEPSFSPDGRQIVFYGWEGRPTGNGLYVMNADGSNQHIIKHDVEAAFPSWAPDGSQIAFSSWRGSRFDIYAINPDGSNERRIVDGEQGNWSPDSQRLAYKGCGPTGCGLMVVNRDGSGQVRLTDRADDMNAAWSPDGRQIAFASYRDGNWEIYVINADGSGLTRLTNTPNTEAHPTWLPDGRGLVFRSDRGGKWGIWVMNADGRNQRQIAEAPTTSRWTWEKMSVTP